MGPSPAFFITDVFTRHKYGGNPLATFVDCESLSDHEMQQIAREINFSETTFITSRHVRDGGFDVRIFTPKEEVEFAGHPTLGTAHVLRKHILRNTAVEIVLNLRVGKIPVTFNPDGSTLWMKQIAPQFGQRLNHNTLARALGLPDTALDTRWPVEEVSTGFPHIIVPLKNLAVLKQAKINHELYNSLITDAWAKIILVFCQEGYEPSQKLGVRVFAPYYGIAEDAATGSGNGALAAYLVKHQVLNSKQIDLNAGQGYEMGRPSTLSLRATEYETFVGGSVVDVAQGVWGAN